MLFFFFPFTDKDAKAQKLPTPDDKIRKRNTSRMWIVRLWARALPHPPCHTISESFRKKEQNEKCKTENW